MPRRFAQRIIAAPVALWFAVTAIDADAVHQCPVHSIAVAGHVGHTAMHAAHTAAMAHAVVGVAGGAPDPSGDHPRSHNDCTCPGACCGPQAFARLAGPAVVIHATVVHRGEAPLGHGDALVASAEQVVLPPALGPPTLHA